MADVMEQEEQVTDLSDQGVVTKYREAAVIANNALAAVLSKLAPGVLIADVCEFGDNFIENALANSFKSKKIEKGIAFPTCISVNECVGHYSPLKSESKALKVGDAAKIDLGVHIDGFCALVAQTVVLGADAATPVTGPQADVMAAAHAAAEVAVRLIKPGNTNTQVTEAITRVAEAYGVNPVADVRSYKLDQFQLAAGKAIALKGGPSARPEDRVEESAFEANEAYAIDIVFSSGEGKPRETDARTTVYKRDVSNPFRCKMKASRWLVAEVSKKAPVLPFTLRALGDESQARLGVVEAVNHKVLEPFPVMYERDGAAVAHVRVTALMLPGGTLKVTGLPVPEYVRSEKPLPADLAELLAQESHTSKKAKKAKKAAGGAGGTMDEEKE